LLQLPLRSAEEAAVISAAAVAGILAEAASAEDTPHQHRIQRRLPRIR
jgi:hypothetical protein